jgi:CDP-glycerol glycerophosphotransferase (TagB/SpsB family)
VKYIKETEISQSLSTANLIISDFSSIIFDFIYRRMPFIMYIPDAIDPEIKYLYEDKYYELINSLKNGTIIFENKFFELNNTIKKILYYIRKDFTLEPKIEKFYDSFNLKKFNITSNFINYLKSLK